MATIGAAVVGTGFIGPVHVEAVRRLGHRVVGILGSSPAKSAAAAASLGLDRGYATFADLLADPAVSVVHIASPNREHFAQCQAAIAAGKHVVCEKPLAMTAGETNSLVEIAAKSNVVTAVNYNVRFYPMVLDARARMRRGQCGELLHATGSYLQDWLLYDTDFNWRVLAEQGGELRAVADIGTHWLDTVQFIAGRKITSVCADLQTVHPIRHRPTGPSDTFSGSAKSDAATVPVPVNTDDAGSILFRFDNGARGCVTVSQVMAGRKNAIRFDLAGRVASLAWDSDEPNSLRIGTRTSNQTLVTRDPGSLGEPGFSDYPAGHAEGFPDTFKMLYRAIYADIAKTIAGEPRGEPIYATFSDGHREVVLCEAILRSHRERCWVDVS
jgi:predicted dehydrogenase